MVVKSGNGRNQKNIETENKSDIDIDQPVREADGDKVIEIDVAAEIDRIIDRRAEQDDLDKNKKRYSII